MGRAGRAARWWSGLAAPAGSGDSAPCCRTRTARSPSCGGTRTATRSARPGPSLRSRSAAVGLADVHGPAGDLLEQVGLLLRGPDLEVAPFVGGDVERDRLAAAPRLHRAHVPAVPAVEPVGHAHARAGPAAAGATPRRPPEGGGRAVSPPAARRARGGGTPRASPSARIG